MQKSTVSNVGAAIVVACLVEAACAAYTADAAPLNRAACRHEVRARTSDNKLTRAEFVAAVERCLRYGPDAIVGEGED